jgi:hypothetical protein
MDMHAKPFDDDMKAEIETLRQSVRRLLMDAQKTGLPRPMALVEQADRIVHRLTHWMLDDEQTQAMNGQPFPAHVRQPTECMALTDRCLTVNRLSGKQTQPKKGDLTDD